jgi:hypothetical protein
MEAPMKKGILFVLFLSVFPSIAKKDLLKKADALLAKSKLN